MTCPHCGNLISLETKKPTKHNLSEKHIRALWKLRQAVKHYGRNAVHIHQEMKCVPGVFQLTDAEWTNMSKLRFHALAFQVEGQSGYWGITARGGQFLRGEIHLPKYAITQDNQVIGHDGPLQSIFTIENGAWWEKPEVEPARQQQLLQA